MNFSRKTLFLFLILIPRQACEGFFDLMGKNGVDALNNLSDKCGLIVEKMPGIVKAGGKHLDKIAIRAADAAKNVGINAATVTAKTVDKVVKVAWAGVATAATFVTYRIGNGIYDRYDKCRKEKAMIIAKKALLDAVIKNSLNKEGLFGFPEGCEKEVSSLLTLPGGNDELEKIRGSLNRR